MGNDIQISKQVGMTSLQIAEVTGRTHSNVMRDIRNVLEQGAGEINFELASYSDKQGKDRPMYNLTPKGCLILASGYDVVLREKIIDKLDEYQQKEKETAIAQLPDFTNPAEAARAWAEQYELKQIEAKRADEAEAQVLELSQEIETMKPKAAFTDAVSASNSSCLIGELAKILRQNGIEMGEKRLFGWMRNNGYLGKHGERYNIPNQEFIERGYFELKKGTRSGNNGVLYTTITPKVTGKGQVYFVNKFINKDLFLFC